MQQKDSTAPMAVLAAAGQRHSPALHQLPPGFIDAAQRICVHCACVHLQQRPTEIVSGRERHRGQHEGADESVAAVCAFVCHRQ